MEREEESKCEREGEKQRDQTREGGERGVDCGCRGEFGFPVFRNRPCSGDADGREVCIYIYVCEYILYDTTAHAHTRAK